MSLMLRKERAKHATALVVNKSQVISQIDCWLHRNLMATLNKNKFFTRLISAMTGARRFGICSGLSQMRILLANTAGMGVFISTKNVFQTYLHVSNNWFSHKCFIFSDRSFLIRIFFQVFYDRKWWIYKIDNWFKNANMVDNNNPLPAVQLCNGPRKTPWSS